ncbi:MAG: TonB-dependent receptor [Parvularcula sp.]|nr:TonB-dependent receptor [Parvularcula sp.]
MTRANRIFLAALLGGTSLSAVTSAPALAQSETSATDDVIVVIGRGREENIQDVPISETVFTAELIKDARIDQVDDFFALTPGVTFANAQDSGTSFITIRGVSQVRNGEAPVAVVIDDVLQVNSRSFDQPLFDIDSIEVLRGPQGALYGRNATGGAIIINTAMPTDEFEGYGQVSYGRGQDIQLEGSVSGPIVPGRILGRISARYSDRDGVLENVILDEKVDYSEDLSLRGHLRFIVSDAVTADLRGSLVRTEGGALNYTYQPAIVDKTTGLPTAFDFTIADADLVEREFTANNLGVDERDAEQVSLRINADLGFATLRSVTAYDHIEETTFSDQFPYTAASTVTPAPPFPLGDGIQSQHIEVEAFSQELRLTSPDDQAFRWMVGAYYVATDRFINSSIYNDLENGLPTISKRLPVFDPLAPQTSFIADDNNNEAWALFFNAAYDLTDRLELAFAGRYDKDSREQQVSPLQGNYVNGVLVSPTGVPGSLNTAEFDLFQPKITARYAALDNLNLYASWGKGFRSGQFNQNGVGAVAAGAGVMGVSDLLPQEETSTYELGFKSTLMDGVTLNASGYRTKVDNAPYFVFIGAVSAQVLVPVDEIEIWGGEVELTANLYDGLDFYAAFGLADSEIQEYTVNPAAVGNYAPYVAKTTFNTGLQYRTPITSSIGIFGRVDYERRGEQFWDPENTTARSALNLVNARAGFEANDGSWALTASVDNLTDEVYNSEWVLGGFANAGVPRLWRVDLRVNF